MKSNYLRWDGAERKPLMLTVAPPTKCYLLFLILLYIALLPSE